MPFDNLYNFTKNYSFPTPAGNREMVSGWLSIKISGKIEPRTDKPNNE